MKNAFFEQMKEQADEYTKDKFRRLEEKKALLARYRDADLEEEKEIDEAIIAWHREEEKHPYPFGDGACKAYMAYAMSRENEASALEVRDLPWEREYDDFTETLKAAGIRDFVVTDKSTALMDGIHELTSRGCRLTGPAVVTRKECIFGTREETEHRGLKFQVI